MCCSPMGLYAHTLEAHFISCGAPSRGKLMGEPDVHSLYVFQALEEEALQSKGQGSL